MSHVVVAEVVRSGFVEGHHHGSAVRVSPQGDVEWSVGDAGGQIYPRSCNKPVQATAMVRAGLPLRGELLALASASHSGEPFHLEGVRSVLAGAGLAESDLQTPPDWPIDDEAREAYIREVGHKTSLAMNCSGKHAAMLATCVHNGWDTATYLDPDHPLQQTIDETFVELTGEPVESAGTDGCGAPLLSTSLTGLARAFSRIVQADPGTAEGAVATAIVGSPQFTSGTRRDELALLRAFPGAIGKAGAEACYAVALPDGTAFACKIDDGGSRARPVVMAEAMRLAGYEHPVLEEQRKHVLLGGGHPVGEVRATFG